jgi:Sulfotransferase domain
MSWLTALIGLVVLFVADYVYLVWYLQWESSKTSGVAYFGKPLAERRALKARIRRYSTPAMPLVRVLAAVNRRNATMPQFEYKGVCGPPRVSSPEVFARAQNYTPGPADVFVATQMRCGTTWMQQVVYEVVNRGQGDLSDTGGHLYAVSPWIDSVNSVPLEDAPLVGEEPIRIIKTHLPASLCPYSPQAKYIYVTRHPVSCFASIVDYNRTLLGPLMPSVEKLEAWFCSDRMYWLPWPKHVDGWWEWARTRENVLFVHYEEMITNFPDTLDRVAGFLGYRLTAEEAARITHKCSFRFMREHEELFEMSPPTMFSVSEARFMPSGGLRRHDDVTPAVRQRIAEYCGRALSASDYPVHRFYPDLLAARGGEVDALPAAALSSSPV